MTVPDEVDIIVCGGGSAGCVPAGREQFARSLAAKKLTPLRSCQPGPQSPGPLD